MVVVVGVEEDDLQKSSGRHYVWASIALASKRSRRKREMENEKERAEFDESRLHCRCDALSLHTDGIAPASDITSSGAQRFRHAGQGDAIKYPLMP